MCGIIGRISLNKQIDRDCFIRMRDSMAHRGPDGSGLFISDDNKVALGHRRLSFLDLSESGSQPMHNENKTIWLTCNGEIYNYIEIKDELIKKGHKFLSNCDSEVIIHGYEEWGTGIVSKMKGMFAFGLWDSNKKQLFLARDRFGIKPLYYYMYNGDFVFSSELKGIVEDRSIKRDIDMTAFSDYFVYRYVPSPKTIWQNMFKLPPAHCMVVNFNLNINIKQYWKLTTTNKTLNEREVIEKVDELLFNSVKQHVISDVPVGSFLSGGYDSSAMVYYMHKLNYPTQTFSIGFENWQFSEHQYAEIVSDIFKTKHISHIIGKESLDFVEQLSFNYDEPIADISIVPTYIVSKIAAMNVKAVLSGEGADEIFAGYTWHKSYNDSYNTYPRFDKLKSIFNSNYKPFGVSEYSHAMAMGKFDNDVLHKLLNEDNYKYIAQNTDWFYQKHYKSNYSPVKSFQNLDLNTFMSELVLTKVDRATMASSLEARVPFLDHEFIEYMFNIKESVYFKKDYKKYILFENLKNVLPKSILTRSKQGFVGPDKYYQQIDWYEKELSNSSLINDELIKKETIKEWLLQKDYWRLWKVIVMEFWYRRWKG